MSQFLAPQDRLAWKALQGLRDSPTLHLRDLLSDPLRKSGYRREAAGICLDFSRQRVGDAVLKSLFDLAKESGVSAAAADMFQGQVINRTEGRKVLHVALRGSGRGDQPWGEAISSAVQAELDRVLEFSRVMRAGQYCGFSKQVITDVVNLGIGGSDLGPRMGTHALSPIHAKKPSNQPNVHYVSNPDPDALEAVLARLNPETTLFIVQSKTFTTEETMTQARSARRWLADGGCPPEHMSKHLVAVTASPELALQEGFSQDNTFLFWDWVGGRFSVWSAIGLPLAIAIGPDAFEDLLAGAKEMDDHFINAPTEQNLPIIMALIGVWNVNFLGCQTQLIVPYAARLSLFVPFLQQLEMESNGKSTHVDGSTVSIQTCPIVWGGLGIDGQHAYFQLLHQGTHCVPVDFIGVKQTNSDLPLAQAHQQVVLQNMRAQADALALGRSRADTEILLRQEGYSEEDINRLAQHRSYRGNVPSSCLWIERLTPRALGALIALYEHKVFCQSVIWGIHAFDQWGVELGKTMVKQLASQAASSSKQP